MSHPKEGEQLRKSALPSSQHLQLTLSLSSQPCRGMSHVAEWLSRRLSARSVLISLNWGALEPGRAETGARERQGRAGGAGPSTLRAGSTFSCFHLDEQLHLAESLERKEKPLTPCS